jgi:protein arginine kinase
MDAEGILSLPLAWAEYGKGVAPAVVSSRVRLARNIERFPFVHRASAGERNSIAESVRGVVALEPLFADCECCPISELDALARGLLVERRLMSPGFLKGCPERMLILDPKGIVSVMVNEEDHLRIQVLLGGLALCEASRIAGSLDHVLSRLGFAFDSEFGFLTTCPTNVGTALRASVMLHLPALKMTRAMPEIITQSGRLGLAVRGAYGEGTTSMGDLYQVSNQVTLGISPEELTEKVEAVASRLVEQETQAREVLLKDPGSLEDRVWRAWGTLSCARRISLGEAMEDLSLVRMGLESGVALPGESRSFSYCRILLNIQPAHVQAKAGRELSPEETEEARAALIRTELSRFRKPAENG